MADEPETLPPPPFRRTRYCALAVMARAERRRIMPDMVLSCLARPIRKRRQPNGRVRYWAWVDDLGSYLTVITLEDGETVHTYYVDEDFRP
jgi:hypothetical protein